MPESIPIVRVVDFNGIRLSFALRKSGDGWHLRFTGEEPETKRVAAFIDRKGRHGATSAVFALEEKPAAATKDKPPLGEGPGTELKRIFESKEFPSCQQCIETANRMNWLGVAGCRDNIDRIVDQDILPRAKAWLAKEMPWAQRLLGAVGADELILRREVLKHVNAAIDAAEAKEKQA